VDALGALNWVDYIALAIVMAGLGAGIRRGAAESVVTLAASLAALVLALHLTPAVAQAAERRWAIEQRITPFLARNLPLPDGSGQIPYSPPALSLYLHLLPSSNQPAAAALAALVGGPAPHAAQPTLQLYLAGLLAQRVLGVAAFAAVLGAVRLASATALLPVARFVRRRPRSAAQRLGAAVLGALTGGLEAAGVTVLMAALAAVPLLAASATGIRRSGLVRPALLLAVHLAPGSSAWLRPWLDWV